MPTSGKAKRPDLLVDTSVAVAVIVADHQHHSATIAALEGRRLGLCGHAAFETFSVLTRLPAPNRRPPGAVVQLLEANFPGTRFLSEAGSARLIDWLGDGRVAGGAVYDALVAAAAVEHGLVLASSDHRALDTYRALQVDVDFVLDNR